MDLGLFVSLKVFLFKNKFALKLKCFKGFFFIISLTTSDVSASAYEYYSYTDFLGPKM